MLISQQSWRNITLLTLFLLLSFPALLKAGPAHLVHIEGKEGSLHLPEGTKQEKISKKWWMGFRWHRGEFRLEPITIMEMKQHNNECMGGKDIRIRIKPTPNLRFMFQTPPKAIKPGQITTVFSGDFLLHPGRDIHLGLAGASCDLDPEKCYHLRAEGKRVKEKNELVFKDYRIFVKFGGKEQVVFQQSKYFAKPVGLKWAGDLDRDGKIDLIFNQNYWAGSSGSSLYVSSLVKDGKFVVLYAEQNPESC